jgi:protoporphyrinogen oxidase
MFPNKKIDTMKTTNEVSSVTVPVTYYKPNNVTTEEAVGFTISRNNNRFKAIPWLTKEERKQTGLPEELEFVYYNYCIVEANNMEEVSLNAIKQIIQELEALDYFD